jgi:hypothetical protein
MLNNPDWDKKAKTLGALIDWLETKDPAKPYCYGNPFNCLAAQYNRSIGRRYDVPGGIEDNFNKKWSFDKKLEWIAANTARTVDTQRTFGGALKLAKEVAA